MEFREFSGKTVDDAIIETYILSKVAQRHAVTPGIKFFPFRDLGGTDEFCMRRKVPNLNECYAVYEAIANYVNAKIDETNGDVSNYCKGLMNRLNRLANYIGIDPEY